MHSFLGTYYGIERTYIWFESIANIYKNPITVLISVCVECGVCVSERGPDMFAYKENNIGGMGWHIPRPIQSAMLPVVRHAHRQTGRRSNEPFLNQTNAF